MRHRSSGAPNYADSVGMRLLFLRASRPAHTEGVCGLVVFALDHVRLAAVIEAEHLVGEVKRGGNQLEPVAKREAALRVDLGVVVEVNVAQRASGSARRPVGELVGVDARLV